MVKGKKDRRHAADPLPLDDRVDETIAQSKPETTTPDRDDTVGPASGDGVRVRYFETGLYSTVSASVADELVSRKRAEIVK